MKKIPGILVVLGLLITPGFLWADTIDVSTNSLTFSEGETFSLSEEGIISNGGGATALDSPNYFDVVGDYAYVPSFYSDSITVFDVSDPANITEVSTIVDDSLGGSATGLNGAISAKAQGNLLYVVSMLDGALSIFDISDPSNLAELGVIKDGVGATQFTNPRHFDVQGDYAYGITSADDALTIFDVSSSTNPVEVGVIQDDIQGGTATQMNNPWGVKVSGNYAYVSGFESVGSIIDISSSTNPVEVGTPSSSNFSFGINVDVAGDYAYYAGYSDDLLAIFDISDPTNPTEVGIIKNGDGATNLDGPWSVNVLGDYAFVASNVSDSLSIFDISDPANIIEVSTIVDDNQGGVGSKLNGAYDVVAANGKIYVTGEVEDSFSVFTTSNKFEVVEYTLSSPPSADVSISFSSDNASYGARVAPETVVFSSNDWERPQFSTISVIDDSKYEGIQDHTSTISHTVSSNDGNYNGLSIADIVVSIDDNDAMPGGSALNIMRGSSDDEDDDADDDDTDEEEADEEEADEEDEEEQDEEEETNDGEMTQERREQFQRQINEIREIINQLIEQIRIFYGLNI